MNTALEDRLGAALSARAEQVRATDLRPDGVPLAVRARWRRPGMVLAAAAVAALVATPLVVRDAIRSPHQALPAGTARQVTGDIDGDGHPDVVRLLGSGVVRVTLSGSGDQVAAQLPAGSRLVGVAGIGVPGQAIVGTVPQATGMRSRESDATVLRLSGGRLVQVRPEDNQAIIRSGADTFWVDDGQLFSGTGIGARAQREVLNVWTYALAGTRLRATPAGQLCWDRTAEPHPTSCRPGHDYRTDLGSSKGLPRLFPEASRAVIAAGGTFTDTVAGTPVTVSLRNVDAVGRVTFSVTRAGTIYTMTTANDSPRGISTTLVADRSGTGIGILLSQETGDGWPMAMYELRGGKIRPVPTRGGAPISLGDGFLAGGARYFRTWQTGSNGLFTRLGRDQAGVHFTVWSWALDHGTLKATNLGPVCIDTGIDPPAVGRC